MSNDQSHAELDKSSHYLIWILAFVVVVCLAFVFFFLGIIEKDWTMPLRGFVKLSAGSAGTDMQGEFSRISRGFDVFEDAVSASRELILIFLGSIITYLTVQLAFIRKGILDPRKEIESVFVSTFQTGIIDRLAHFTNSIFNIEGSRELCRMEDLIYRKLAVPLTRFELFQRRFTDAIRLTSHSDHVLILSPQAAMYYDEAEVQGLWSARGSKLEELKTSTRRLIVLTATVAEQEERSKIGSIILFYQNMSNVLIVDDEFIKEKYPILRKDFGIFFNRVGGGIRQNLLGFVTFISLSGKEFFTKSPSIDYFIIDSKYLSEHLDEFDRAFVDEDLSALSKSLLNRFAVSQTDQRGAGHFRPDMGITSTSTSRSWPPDDRTTPSTGGTSA